MNWRIGLLIENMMDRKVTRPMMHLVMRYVNMAICHCGKSYDYCSACHNPSGQCGACDRYFTKQCISCYNDICKYCNQYGLSLVSTPRDGINKCPECIKRLPRCIDCDGYGINYVICGKHNKGRCADCAKKAVKTFNIFSSKCTC